ncbi:MAG: APC family permease [Flavisolibacter sp.]|jgi:APA family basic amino acid/polyamine antiporter
METKITKLGKNAFVKPEDATKVSLKRVLGLGTALLMVAGSMIGTGIFKKIVPMAATGLNETYILAAWIAAGLISLFGAFTVAGLAKITTESGGKYEYLRICFGNFIGFLFGWATFIIIGSGSVAAISFIFSQSLASFISVPELFNSWKDISIAHSIFPFANGGIKIISIVVIVSLTLFNYRGIKNGAALNNVVTIAKVLGILFLIVLGIFLSNPSVNPKPVSSAIAPPQGLSLFSIFFAIMLSAFWAYDGFANVAAISGEIKNPKRNVPLAVVTGVSVVIVLYVLVNFAFMKSVPLNEIAALGNGKVAAIVAAQNVLGKTGALIISILILVSTFGWLNIGIVFYSRYYYRMAQENMFFKSASKVHPVYRTPYVALLIPMCWSCIFVISGSFDVLTDMTTMASYCFYIMLAIGLIKLKRKGVIKEKIAAYPAAPALFIFFTLIVIVNTFINSFERSVTGLVLVLSGVPFYYLFRMKSRRSASSL